MENDFEINMHSVISNSVFGIPIQNNKKQRDIGLAANEITRNKLASMPRFKGVNIIVKRITTVG